MTGERPAGADDVVDRWLLRRFRSDPTGDATFGSRSDPEHLAACPDATVTHEGSEGSYGCDTGCDYARLEATVTCPHGPRVVWEYGDFGELADLVAGILTGEATVEAP